MKIIIKILYNNNNDDNNNNNNNNNGQNIFPTSPIENLLRSY